MPIVHAPADRQALVALRDTIDHAKAGDPLAPVTVVVPSNYAGLSLRRLLASGDLGPPPSGATGLLNVRFLVASQVAALLGAAALAAQGRRPLGQAVLAEAARAALAADPRQVGPVAAHPSTARALERVSTELRPCDDATLDRLASRSRRAADLVALHRATRARLNGWYDIQDLGSAAVDAIATTSPALADLGHLVAWRTEVAGGPPAGDEMTTALVDALGQGATSVVAVLDPGTTATSVISVPDPDEEARTVARAIAARVEAGVALHRMAVAYPVTHPSALLLHQHLTAAGIAHNGPSVRTLASTVTGTVLSGLLGLTGSDLRRDEVIGWLAAGPVLDPATGDPVPTQAWDTESRLAGVVTGRAQWTDRLDRHLATLVEAHESLLAEDDVDVDVDERELARLTRRHQQTAELQTFVRDLAATLDVGDLGSWSAYVDVTRRALDAYLGSLGRRQRWPDDEQAAWDSITGALERLATLDGIGPPPDLAAFRRAVERDLDGPAGRLGAFGDGVFLAPLALLAGVDVDVVFVVGVVEGSLPGPARDDAMLPEAERFAAGGPSASRGRSIEDQHRQFLVAATTGTECVLLCPRADLGRNREHLPSRWLLTTAAALAGVPGPVAGDELVGLAETCPAIHVVPSFVKGLAEARAPASIQDRDLAELLGWTREGRPAATHLLARRNPRFGAGLAAEAARLSTEFTSYDGRVTAGAVPALDGGAPRSPTGLQDYAACPRRFLLGHVLRVRAVDRPEDVDAIAPSERGTVVHAILEQYVNGRIAVGAGSLADLERIAAHHLDELERSAKVGRPLRWRYDRELIERELRRFHADDHLQPLAVELAFGMDGRPPVTFRLPSGRELAFKGVADRVDRNLAGALVVTDYKTGSTRDYDAITADPVARGTKLQLPIYAMAAQDRFDAGSAPVEARYWFVSERAGFTSIPVTLDAATIERFTEAVSVVVDGVTAGAFPARPGESESWPVEGWANCHYCAFDRLCPTDRSRHWQAKRSAPEVAAYAALAEGDLGSADEPEAVTA